MSLSVLAWQLNAISLLGEFSIVYHNVSPAEKGCFYDIIKVAFHRLGEDRRLLVTPSKSRFYKFAFPAGVTQVAVKSRSSDEICLTVSVQSPQVLKILVPYRVRSQCPFFGQCPVFDTIYNVEYEGLRQTMTGRSTIIVQVHAYVWPNELVYFFGGELTLGRRAERALPRRLLSRVRCQHRWWKVCRRAHHYQPDEQQPREKRIVYHPGNSKHFNNFKKFHKSWTIEKYYRNWTH